MSVVNLSCPKCGSRATEYDQHKWQCLAAKCGIKFIYEPAAPNVVTNNVSNHYDADAVYNLDMDKTAKAKHIVSTLANRFPEKYREKLQKISYHRGSLLERLPINERKMARWTAVGLVALLVTVWYVLWWLFVWGSEMWGLKLVGLLLLIGIMSFIKGMEEYWAGPVEMAKHDIKLWNTDEKTLRRDWNEVQDLGYQPICPHCESETDARKGLNHCHSCGKQFHFNDNVSYALKGERAIENL